MKRGNPIWLASLTLVRGALACVAPDSGLLGLTASNAAGSEGFLVSYPIRSSPVTNSQYRDIAIQPLLIHCSCGRMTVLLLPPYRYAPMTREMMQCNILAVLCCATFNAYAADSQP